MKTRSNQNTKSGLLSRPEPLSIAVSRQINFIRHKVNRSLETAKLLAVLQNEAPKFFERTEVVGKWVWIQFTDKQSAQVTCILAELGFH